MERMKRILNAELITLNLYKAHLTIRVKCILWAILLQHVAWFIYYNIIDCIMSVIVNNFPFLLG